MSQPKYVVLLVIDCLRADHLGSYGYARETSPTIDSLAAAGARFEQCYPQAVYTFPSHVSMLTSIHHASHRRRNGDLFNYNMKTIADYLKEAGYSTAAFISNGMLAGDLGFRDHFDHYDDGISFGAKNTETFSRSAEATTRAVKTWLESNKTDRTFLFIHFNDCHGPYHAPEPYRDLFIGDPLYRGEQTLPIGPGEKGVIAPEYAIDGRQEIDFYVAQYDAALRYIDDHIKELYAFLTADVPLEDMLLIITGDHGEAMGEHGIYFMHGNAFYEEFLRVPLIVAGRQIAGGTVVNKPVRHIDILPSVLDDMNLLSAADTIHGKSLQPLIRKTDAARWDAEVFGVSVTSAYIRQGDWKYIKTKDYSMVRRKQGVAEVKRRIKQLVFRPNEELFHLKDDPREANNLIEQERSRANEMKQRLEQLLATYAAFDLDALVRTDATYADEEQIQERLRALGYIE